MQTGDAIEITQGAVNKIVRKVSDIFSDFVGEYIHFPREEDKLHIRRDFEFIAGLGMPNRFVKIDLNRFLRSVQEIDKIRRNRFFVYFCQNSRTIFVSFHFVIQLPRFAIKAWTLR